MDFSKLLNQGDTVVLNAGEKCHKATVALTSVVDYERRYFLRFEDGSSRWVNQALVRSLLTVN